jgi:hypothetical protein
MYLVDNILVAIWWSKYCSVIVQGYAKNRMIMVCVSVHTVECFMWWNHAAVVLFCISMKDFLYSQASHLSELEEASIC